MNYRDIIERRSLLLDCCVSLHPDSLTAQRVLTDFIEHLKGLSEFQCDLIPVPSSLALSLFVPERRTGLLAQSMVARMRTAGCSVAGEERSGEFPSPGF